MMHMWKSTIELGNDNSVQPCPPGDEVVLKIPIDTPWYRIFYIPVTFAFNLPHYFTSYMQNTGKRESEQEI